MAGRKTPRKKVGETVTADVYLVDGLQNIATRLEAVSLTAKSRITAKARRDGMKTFATAFGRLSGNHQRLILDMVEEVVPMLKKAHAASSRKEKRHG